MIDFREYDEEYICVEDASCEKETGAAILVEIDGESVWVPKSQIHEDSEVYEEDTSGNLIVSKWWGKEKGLWEDD